MRMGLAAVALAGALAVAPAVRAQGAPTRDTLAWRPLRAYVDSLLAEPALASAQLGVLVVDPARGDTLVSRQAGKLFMPASNQKLLTGAVALARLGPGFTWRTVLATDGRVRGGTLAGDLRVIGDGDPSWSDAMRGDVRAAFDSVAQALRARGIRRITGRLVHAGDALPGSGYGFGWAFNDFDEPYSAPVDELELNEGLATAVVTGTRAGRPARVAVRPAAGALPLRAMVRTARAGEARIPLSARFEDGRYVLRGTLAAGESASVALAIREPGRAWLAALREALARAGVRVTGRDARDSTARAPRDTLLVLPSPPLARVLAAIEKPSQNQLAELLFRTLGAQLDSGGTERAGRRVVTAQLARWGVDSSRAAVRDGSGLSRHDYVAPEAIVRVLDAMWRSADSGTFRAALPVAGVDGTLATRMRGTPTAGRVSAKTGTLDKARSLSGYVTTAGGATLLVSLMANNWATPVRVVDRVHEAILARLVALPLTSPGDADRR